MFNLAKTHYKKREQEGSRWERTLQTRSFESWKVAVRTQVDKEL